jgi:putative photosynthetic complex assembly protein
VVSAAPDRYPRPDSEEIEMNDSFRTTSFPRGPLVGAAFLVVVALIGVAMFRVSGLDTTRVADSPVLIQGEFRFEDRPDGSIVVTAGREGHVVETVAPGTNGFLRGTLRGLARERRRQGIGPEQPFQLVGHADGRLTLEDPATGRRVDLEAFGPTNAGVFVRLLNTQRTDG